MDYVLVHHGIKGQKWGIRRYQNEDGSLTPEGKERYNAGISMLKDYGDNYAALEKMTRELNDGVPKGTQILVPSDVKKMYEETFTKWMRQHNLYSKNLKEFSSDIQRMDDGYDYVVSRFHDLALHGYIEYYSLIGKSKNN